MTQPDTFTAGTIPSSETVPPAVPTSIRGRGVLVLVLILVNGAAIWGQTGWALDHIVPKGFAWGAGLALSLGFAAALEMIGVFLASMADQAESQQLPAGGIRLGSYAVGLFSGGLNVSHFLGVTVAAAVAFGFLSAVSPFLWGIYARVRRGRPVAPSRRFWHPVESVRVIRYAAWVGIVDEDEAVRELEFRKAPELAPVSPGASMSKTDIGREAFRLKEEDPNRSWENIAQEFGISASHLYQCRKAARATGGQQ